MVQSMYANEKTMNAYASGIGVFINKAPDSALAQVDCWCGGLIALGIGPQFTTDHISAFQPPLAQLLPRIKFW
jgi:hypothetical protein